MVVMMIDRQLLSAKQVCQSCLMANRFGQPRWNRGELGCGKIMEKSDPDQATVYRCHMGFNVTQID